VVDIAILTTSLASKSSAQFWLKFLATSARVGFEHHPLLHMPSNHDWVLSCLVRVDHAIDDDLHVETYRGFGVACDIEQGCFARLRK
jgi:hypothetical protein